MKKDEDFKIKTYLKSAICSGGYFIFKHVRFKYIGEKCDYRHLGLHQNGEYLANLWGSARCTVVSAPNFFFYRLSCLFY